MRFPQLRQKTWVIVILVLFLTLYLGGLIGQGMTRYGEWVSHGGLTQNNIEMSSISFSPFTCIAYAFSPSGLKGCFFVLVGSGILIAVLKLHDRFGSKDKDDRGFSVSKTATYGSASWMTAKEMKSIYELGSPGAAVGTILGQKQGQVICLPDDTRLNKHIIAFGATGTRKTRGFIFPYLFQSIKRGESVIITDCKTELYTATAELFRQNGYTVKVFNLVDPDHSDSWNPMSDLKGDTLMAQLLTNVIITNTSGERGDHFWDNGEGNLLKALVLYVDQETTRGLEDKHLPAVYQLLVQNSEKELSAKFNRLPIDHPARAPYSLFAQASDTVRAGIVLGLGTRLQVLQNEAIRKITSSSEIDLIEPAKTKCAYFVVLSDQESSLDYLSSLFFSFLFIKLVRHADSTTDGRCPVPVNLVLEEANNIGAIEGLARRMSTIRSRMIQVVMTVQNLAQLKNRYPQEQWAEILGNMDTQLLYGCTDDVTAEHFSVRSGDMTVQVESTMTVRKTIAVAQMIPQYRHNEGIGRRRLLTPDEVLRLPNDEMLIVTRGQKVLKAEKFDFTDHPLSQRAPKCNIADYRPSRPDGLLPSHQTELPQPPDTPQAPPGRKLYGAQKPPDEF